MNDAGVKDQPRMRFLPLTQANTGVKIHVNMDQVVVVAPNKTGGSVLLTTAVDKDAARIVPVRETPGEVMGLLDGAPAAAGDRR